MFIIYLCYYDKSKGIKNKYLGLTSTKFFSMNLSNL